MEQKVSKERVRRWIECVPRAGNNPVNASSAKLEEEKRARRVETKDNRTVGQGEDFGKNASNSGSVGGEMQHIEIAAYNTG